MKHLTTLCALLLAVTVAVGEETGRATSNPELDGVSMPHNEAAWRAGWPSKMGPNRNYTLAETDTPLVEDVTQARVAWISQSRLFGWAKTGTTGYRDARTIEMRIGEGYQTPPGAWGGPIVGDDKVFGVACLPGGRLYEALDAVKKEKARFYFDCDDILVALDARTGKEAWVAREPDGMMIANGKRGGFAVMPVYHEGVVYWMGGSGRLYAHRSADGERLWKNQFVSERRLRGWQGREDARRAMQETGVIRLPRTPDWHSSLVVCEGVLVAPTFKAGQSGHGGLALAGLDLKTGQQLWELPDMVNKYVTPSVWRHKGREYLLTANGEGVLRLSDAVEGKVLWEVTGLGSHSYNLAFSDDGVIVNTRNIEARDVFGLPGYYRLSPEGAEHVWTLPDEPEYYFVVSGPAQAKTRMILADGVFYYPAGGYRETNEFITNSRGYYYLIDEQTGTIRQRHVNRGKRDDSIAQLIYVMGNGTLLTRADAGHGPNHGGRHPFYLWRAEPGQPLRVLGDDTAPNVLDLTDFAVCYHTFMETPIVDGRMFERLEDGRVACIDLRRVPGDHRTLRLGLDQGFVGLPEWTMPVRLTFDAATQRLLFAKSHAPTATEAGLTGTRNGLTDDWNRCAISRAGSFDDVLAARLDLNFGTHFWPTTLKLVRDGDAVSGTWTREIPALREQKRCAGEVERVAGPFDRRGIATPWLKGQPYTFVADAPAGARTYELFISAPFGPDDRGRQLAAYLDIHEDGRVMRCTGLAMRSSQSMVEFDTSGLTVAGTKLSGRMVAVINCDLWVKGSIAPNPETGTGVAMELEVDIDLQQKTGTFRSVYGVAHTVTGTVSGAFE